MVGCSLAVGRQGVVAQGPYNEFAGELVVAEFEAPRRIEKGVQIGEMLQKKVISKMEYKVCSRCIIDTTVPGVTFDEKGECNFCKLHDRLERAYPLTPEGSRKLARIIEKIKKSGIGKKFDCIAGLSGGRDSTYTLYLLKKFGLRPLAVHFNDGFGNPVAGENMRKVTAKLGVELRTITSDWRESKDIKIAFLKASTPDMEEGTDIGIASALYGTAFREGVKYVIIGQSFRTEGISPLVWNYLDGKYLKNVHRRFGSVKLRRWKPEDPGFNLDLWHLFYYIVLRGIRTVPLLYYVPYVRKEAEAIITELGWRYPGAHYYDDLYQSLMTYVLRVKFNIDRRKFNYSALVRSGQMTRDEALERIKEVYVIEDPKIIDLCIKRLGITHQELDKYLAEAPKTFRDYPTSYNYIRFLRIPLRILSTMNIIPAIVYDKYFNCG
ncbi:MAG: N-acetyl sugar amidotransferase [Candidatus Omnitrophica bacterium]|nr:N-acetyl sugar amidotransferase [Candidatus Omnitrophota bacterium]